MIQMFYIKYPEACQTKRENRINHLLKFKRIQKMILVEK